MSFDIEAMMDRLTAQLYDSLTGATRNRRIYNPNILQRRASPVHKDVIEGVYMRYFVCWAHLVKSGPVIEIDARQYKSLTSNPLLQKNLLLFVCR